MDPNDSNKLAWSKTNYDMCLVPSDDYNEINEDVEVIEVTSLLDKYQS